MSEKIPLLLSKDKKNPYISVYKSSGNSEAYDVYFELALLEKVNNGLNSFQGKHLVARLYNANFERKRLVETFGVALTTIRRWGNALKTGDIEVMIQAFSGQGATPKITPDIDRYIRVSFSEIYPNNSYSYSKEILSGIENVFNVNLSSESIRPIINEEKAKLKSVVKDDKEDNDSASHTIAGKAVEKVDINTSQNVNSGANTCESTQPVSSQKSDNRKHSLSCLNPQPDIKVHHIGLVLAYSMIKSLEFDQKITYQWLTSVLLGYVNLEQTEAVDFKSLELLLGQNCITSARHQHSILTKISSKENTEQVFRENAKLIGVDPNGIFYYDPHGLAYTGMQEILKGWCGAMGKVVKVNYQDFFHDVQGNPLYMQIHDNRFDMRERLLRQIDDFKRVALGDINASPTLVIDRGIYGKNKMEKIDNMGIGLVTWEKNYRKDAWDDKSNVTEFLIERPKNCDTDIKTWQVKFIQDRSWNKINNFYRLIVRIKAPKKGRNGVQKEAEVSILTNGKIDDQKAVLAMLNRWIQENDFKYMIKHFGLNEITSYKAKQYSYEMLDRLEIEKKIHSDEYKQYSRDLRKQREKLKTILLEKDKCSRKAKVFKKEAIYNQLIASIETLEQCKKNENGKVGKLEILIQKNTKILNSNKKYYLDSVKILARNIFCKLMDTFRPIYNNYREDHKLVRELTRASGMLQVTETQLNFKIDTTRNYSRTQKKAVNIFLTTLSAKIRENAIFSRQVNIGLID